jgi:serine/threonine protein kinase
MAEVFAGHSVGDHGFQKPVAIKRLLPELANDEVFVERLIEEAKLLVGMQHGNIVSVLDLARESDDVFLVMEFVDGPSLRQLIKARGARGLSLGVATYVVQSAAAGLEFAHARPGGAIIHADISPSNLLLTTSGEVRVADFGIARREGLGQGVVEGKWAYMAPEQARGESLTPSSDVFALGVVLYELLTGQHPFGRVVTANQRDDQMRVIPPRVVKSSIPHGLDAICMRALAHDPRDRYGRMQQLIDVLVEERFGNGYREGASDLATAIREVAPKPDVAMTSRTMHTERPVTLVTRSLLPDDPLPRRSSNPPSRPSNPPSRPSSPPSRSSNPPSRPSRTPTQAPSYPLGPHDPPPRDAFPMQPTIGAQTMALLAEPLPAPPLAPLSGELPRVPSSGAQTTARVVDQLALAQAASAAAAMLQLPGGLRADGTPMPPFRLSDAGLHGDELASVVGGHTMTEHGASVAVETRGHRWTVGVLASATLLGVVAALVIQLTPDRGTEPAQVQPSIAAPANRPGAAAATTPDPLAELKRAEPSVQPLTLPPVQPTIQDPAAANAAAANAAAANAAAANAAAANAEGANAAAANAAAVNAAPANAAAANAAAANAEGANAAAANAAPANAAAVNAAPANARPASLPPSGPDIAPGAPASGPDARNAGATGPQNPPAGALDAPLAAPTEGSGRRDASRPLDEPRPASRVGEARPVRRPQGKDSARRKTEPGILSVQSAPWSWVTVGNQTKETPGARFTLAPGTYQVTFHNEANGLVKVEHVTIESGKMRRLNEQMDR